MDWNDRHNLEEQLSAYLDDELTDAERAEVEAALAQDEQARRTLAELRQTAGLLGSLPRGKAPADLIESLAAQMERSALLNGAPASSTSLPPAGGRLLRFLASAAVIVLAVSAGLMTFSYLGEEREPPRASSFGPLADAGDGPKEEELRRGRSGEVTREAKTFDALVESDVVVEPAPAKPETATGREAMDTLKSRDGLAVGGEIALRAKQMALTEIEPDIAEPKVPERASSLLFGEVSDDETGPSSIANAPLDLHDKQPSSAAPSEAPARAEFADALAVAALEKAAATVPTEVGQIASTTDDAAARKIEKGVPAEEAEPSDADTVRVELVYADAATRDAAAVPIEAMVGQWQSMDAMVGGRRGFGSAEVRGDVSTPAGEANAGSALVESGDKVIVLDGSPEVIREAVRYVEQVGAAAGSVRMKVDAPGLGGDRSNVPMPVRLGEGGSLGGPSVLGIDASQRQTQVAPEPPSSKVLAEPLARPAAQSVVVAEQQQLAGRRVAARTASAPTAAEARSGAPGQAVDHEAAAQVGHAASSPALMFADQAKEPRRMRLQIRLVAQSAVTASTQPATTQPAPAATRPSVDTRPTSGSVGGM